MSILILGGGWTFLLTARPRLEDGSLAPLNIGGRVLTGMEQKAGLGVRCQMLASLCRVCFVCLATKIGILCLREVACSRACCGGNMS